jgi:L-arabinokinase
MNPPPSPPPSPPPNPPPNPTAVRPPPPAADALSREPAATLLARVRSELASDFRTDRPIRISRAPGRLDVMGGIADYTGSLVCELPLDRAAAVALQERDDRQVQVFSFNLFDEHVPFTLRMPLDALAGSDDAVLRREFAEPGRKFAGYILGCLFILHEAGLVDLRAPAHRGLNLALFSTVPPGAGVSSSAAIEVATMVNLVDHFGLSREKLDPVHVAALCQQVENRIVGAACGIMDQVTSCCGRAGLLLRMVCQPHVLQPPLTLPEGVRVVGINSGVRHSVGGTAYSRTRCAAFMAHAIILERMRQLGAAAGRTLAGDPMNGYLANLDPDDYKNLFRRHLPQWMMGSDFLSTYAGTIDPATVVAADLNYPVQHAADHHVLEARRVRKFAGLIEQASGASGPARGAALDRAGHLMYASHLSYTNDAMLGATECDALVDLVRRHERSGLYGARITGGGAGGTVAVLCEVGPRADAALAELMQEYATQTGRTPELFTGTSDGAWHEPTHLIT